MATQTRLPTGDGSNNDWTASSGGSKFADIDDPVGTPDDDATYISKTTPNGTQSSTFTAFDITSSAVAKVSVLIRAKRNAEGSNSARPTITTGTTLRVVDSFALTESYADYVSDWLTNPATGSAWAEDEVEGTAASPGNRLTQYGINSTGLAGAEEMRCTQNYCTVDYTEAGGGDITSEPPVGAAVLAGGDTRLNWTINIPTDTV